MIIEKIILIFGLFGPSQSEIDAIAKAEREEQARKKAQADLEKKEQLLAHQKVIETKEKELLKIKLDNAEKEAAALARLAQTEKQTAQEALRREKEMASRELKAKDEVVEMEKEAARKEREMREHSELILQQKLEYQEQYNDKIMQTHIQLFDQFRQSMEKFQSFGNTKPEGSIQNRKNNNEMIENARIKLNLDVNNYYNFAFVGYVKSGKSSLINALRGITKKHEKAAAVDNLECTKTITLYTFPNSQYPRVRLYDTPGCGTLSVGSENHYETFGLCAFDCLIILVHETLSLEEINLAKKAKEYHQPVAFVRSKCDIDVLNENDEESEQTQKEANAVMKKLQDAFCEEISKKAPDLRDVPIYCVSSRVLQKLVAKTGIIDYMFGEQKLLEFIRLKALHSRNLVEDD